jgi:periplasmic protein TonB
MSMEEKRSAEKIGTLGSCLIDGDTEQKSRERKTKRRALTISIALQSIAIVALVVTPLLAKPEKLPFTWYTPIPHYSPAPAKPVEQVPQQIQRTHGVCITCIHDVAPIPIAHDNTPLTQTPMSGDTFSIGDSVPDGSIPMIGVPSLPKPPEDTGRNQTKRIVKGGEVQQAMLTHRVEPCYPPLAKQLRRSGQVRLRAVISTDGAVESLQLIDGDPLFIQCAMDAVRQWRYRPTTLNGSPVEVETVITVVYTLNQ